MSKKVLVVEDEEYWQKIIADSIKKLMPDVEILFATNPPEARQALSGNPDIQIVTVDGVMGYDRDAGKKLVREIRPTFRGKIIAASSGRPLRRDMMEAGADEQCGIRGKHDVADLVKGFLDQLPG